MNLARALAAKPRLLLCDEVTSALDTLVAAAILDLLAELRKELGLTTMFISHDLKTIRAICDQVLVLYAGRVVETLPAGAIAAPGHHPYAKLLFSSVPALHQGWLDGLAAPSMPASATDAQGKAGCTFFHRCELRMGGTCDRIVPPMRQTPEGLNVACHHPLDA